MSLRRLLPVLVFVGSCLSLTAGNWSLNEPLGSNKRGTINLRYRRDESRDDREKGYGFVFEITNTNDRQGARVSFSFGVQDPQTLRWSNASKSEITHVLEVGPEGTASGSVYSPYPTGLDYYSAVEWVDGLAPSGKKAEEGSGVPEYTPLEREGGEKAVDPAKPEDSTTKEAKPRGPTFEGVELSDIDGIREKIKRSEYFRAVLVLHWQGHDDYSAGEGSSERATWNQAVMALLENYRDPHYQRPGISLASFRIRKSTPKEIVVEFDEVFREYLDFILGVINTPPVDILELSSLGNGSIVAGNEKFIHASQPGSETKSAPVTEVKKSTAKPRHNGYWIDPGDKEAKGSDPVIYVRVDGTARRMNLSVAKRVYAVPDEATSDTMSVYVESLGMVVKDKKTHRPQPGR
jgi:hypothetical protein